MEVDVSDFVMKGGEKEIMKALIKRKTSALVAFFMIASMLLPIAAFAAEGFANLVHNAANGTVSGRVYTDTYVAGVTPVVALYDKDGNRLDIAVQVTYVDGYTVDGHVYYDITADVSAYGSTYFPLNARYYYDTTNPSAYVSANVTQGVVAPPIFGGGGGGNNGGSLNANADGTVSASALKDALADGAATIKISGNVALLPASALTEGGTVTIVANGASYKLPLDVLNLEELAKELGVEIDGLTIKVTIDAVTGELKTNVESAATAAGAKVIGGIFDFKVEAVAGDKTIELNDFGSYVERTIDVAAGTTSGTGVLYDPATGEFSFIPATFKDGVATLKSTHNSIYTVIEAGVKSFADLANHWAKEDVEKLAGMMIVKGTGADKFEPTRAITRAEFAALIARSLGLATSGTTDKFSDVASSAWYAGAVAAAAEAGIVNGDTAGTFRPNAVITRQELAAMVVRAMKFAGKEVTLTDAQVSEALAAYTDADKLGWAKAEVAAAISAGIVKGQSATSVAPLATSNRAEAATMVIRLLTNVGFIQ